MIISKRKVHEMNHNPCRQYNNTIPTLEERAEQIKFLWDPSHFFGGKRFNYGAPTRIHDDTTVLLSSQQACRGQPRGQCYLQLR